MSDFTIKANSYCPVCKGIVGSDCHHSMERLREAMSPYVSSAVTMSKEEATSLARKANDADALAAMVQLLNTQLATALRERDEANQRVERAHALLRQFLEIEIDTTDRNGYVQIAGDDRIDTREAAKAELTAALAEPENHQ